ncbi:MAG: hypothetical protein NTW87_09890 [Planctomycetota bacterium]|nr:hypothetical protein [Planctomycetota bacterium]
MLTKGQKQLRDLALLPARGAFDFDTVLAQNRSGATSVVVPLLSVKPDKHTNRCIHVHAAGGFEAVDNIALQAGTVSNPAAWSRTLFVALAALSGPERWPVCLLLDSAELMKTADMARLALALDWVALHSKLSVRAVLLCRQVKVWKNKEQERRPEWPVLPDVLRDRMVGMKKHYYTLERSELEKLPARELPCSLFESAA